MLCTHCKNLILIHIYKVDAILALLLMLIISSVINYITKVNINIPIFYSVDHLPLHELHWNNTITTINIVIIVDNIDFNIIEPKLITASGFFNAISAAIFI